MARFFIFFIVGALFLFFTWNTVGRLLLRKLFPKPLDATQVTALQLARLTLKNKRELLINVREIAKLDKQIAEIDAQLAKV